MKLSTRALQKVFLHVWVLASLHSRHLGRANTATVQIIDIDESDCNDGAGCDNAAGYYCDEHYHKCLECSVCPDPYTGSVRNLYVVRVCLKNGFCPKLCKQYSVGNDLPANETLCINENFQQVPDCNLFCLNGGTLSRDSCQCTCSDSWAGADCSECPLTCQNGGRLDPDSCQCFCSQYWTGDTCSDCGLVCDNLGTLNNTSCQCLCSDGWTGVTCTEPRRVAEVPGHSTKVPYDEKGTLWYMYVWVPIAAVLTAVCGAVKCFKKMQCIRKNSGSDVERPILGYEMNVEGVTSKSFVIKVEAQNHRKKKMRLGCNKTDSSPQFSDILSRGPDGIARHTFSNLEPATAYTIRLQVMDSKNSWQEVKTLQASTEYESLQVVVDKSGRSATVHDLQRLQCNALVVCSCLVRDVNQRWISIPPEADEVQLSGIQPGLVYTMRAAVVDSARSMLTQDLDKALCRYVAKGTFKVPGNTGLMEEVCETTIGDVLEDISLSRSLNIEINSREMARLIAHSCGLIHDNLRRVVNAADRNNTLDTLSEILESSCGRGRAIPVHEVMEKLSEFITEAEKVVWKLAKISDFGCPVCMRLLHGFHSEERPSTPVSSPDLVVTL